MSNRKKSALIIFVLVTALVLTLSFSVSAATTVESLTITASGKGMLEPQAFLAVKATTPSDLVFTTDNDLIADIQGGLNVNWYTRSGSSYTLFAPAGNIAQFMPNTFYYLGLRVKLKNPLSGNTIRVLQTNFKLKINESASPIECYTYDTVTDGKEYILYFMLPQTGTSSPVRFYNSPRAIPAGEVGESISAQYYNSTSYICGGTWSGVGSTSSGYTFEMVSGPSWLTDRLIQNNGTLLATKRPTEALEATTMVIRATDQSDPNNFAEVTVPIGAVLYNVITGDDLTYSGEFAAPAAGESARRDGTIGATNELCTVLSSQWLINGSDAFGESLDTDLVFGYNTVYSLNIVLSTEAGNGYFFKTGYEENFTFNGVSASTSSISEDGKQISLCFNFPKTNRELIVSATLNDDIKLNFGAVLSGEETGTTMRFTKNGKVTVAGGVSVGEMYCFTYEGVTPQTMTDTITAELILDDKVIGTKTCSVADYLKALQTKTAEEVGVSPEKKTALDALCDALLDYGTEAQRYKSYKVETVPSEGVDTEAWTEPTAAEATFTVSNNETRGFTVANVVFDDKIGLLFTMRTTREGDTVIWRKNGGSNTEATIVSVEEGVYELEVPLPVSASDFATPYVVALKGNDPADTDTATLTFTVNAYIKGMQNNAKIGNLVKALYNYGVAANAYANIPA